MSLHKHTKDLLQSAGSYPKKRLGQNFLIDQNIFDLIVESAELSPEDIVVEIGAGTGTLTKKLAESSARVIAVELDEKLFHILQSDCQDIVNIIPVHADILSTCMLSLLGEKEQWQSANIKIVGNLPYYITTPILMKVLYESSFLPIRMVLVMVQEEVAERMVAPPGNKEYGALSIAIAYRSGAKIVKRIPANRFYPQPKVDSALVRLDIKDNPSVHVEDEELFFQIVRYAFQYRRKTLRNALLTANRSGKICLPIGSIEKAMQSLGFDIKRRGETLNINEFADLANQLSKSADHSSLKSS